MSKRPAAAIALCSVALALLLLRRRAAKASRKPISAPSDSKKSQKSSIYWKKIISVISPQTDPAAQRLLLGMGGCALGFALIDAFKARTGGELFRAVFLGARRDFKRLLLKNIALSLALVLANKLLANLVSSLARHWQERLVRAIHEKYFQGANYYRIQQRVEFAHERICVDAAQLTRDLSLIACDFVNSLTNFTFFGSTVFFVVKRIAGSKRALQISLGPLAYALTAWSIITLVSPNYGFMRKTQRALETAYRQAQMRFARNTEAVATYKGEQYEQAALDKHYEQLARFISRVRSKKFLSEVFTQYMQKYCTHSVMLALVLLPFFGRASAAGMDAAGGGSEMLYQIRYLADLVYMEMLSLGALARLLTTVRQVSGIVDRVGQLIEELDACSDVRQTAGEEPRPSSTPHGSSGSLGLDQDRGGSIKFDKVTVSTPNGHVLVRDLTLEIKQGQNLIIAGANGAGKSSIFRVLGGLWKIPTGTISKPTSTRSGEPASIGLHSNIFYLPQKPYSVIGTLAENVTYPNTSEHVDETELLAVLRLVELESLFVEAKKAGTLATVQNWEMRLSLGEQQRLAMARLFWQRPTFAILDECTSGVSLKMERRLFRICRQLGITLITISHRPALQEFHDRILYLDGAGGYSIRNIDKPEGAKAVAPSWSSADVLNATGTSVPLERVVSRLERTGSIHRMDLFAQAQKQAEASCAASSAAAAEDESKAQAQQSSSSAEVVKMMRAFVKQKYVKEHFAGLLGVVMLKTYLTNTIAHINGHSVRLLMRGETRAFMKLVAAALSLGLAQAVLIPGLDLMEESLAQLWRTWLTKHLMDKYLKDKNFYRITALERRLDIQPDQVLVEDVEKLCTSVANLWTEAAKPVVDFLWFNASVVGLTGWSGFAWLVCYMAGGLVSLRLVRPDLAQLTADKERLDGEFSQVHARLAAAAESVAFLDGGKAERRLIEEKFEQKLAQHEFMKKKEHVYGVFDQFVSVFLPHNASWILSMHYKETQAADRSDARLTHDLRYLGTVVSQSFSALGTLMELTTKWSSTAGHLQRIVAFQNALDSPLTAVCGLTSAGGQTGVSVMPESPDVLELNKVDIRTPGSQATLLVQKLSFRLEHAKDKGLMIAGQTGAGKSAVLRVIYGLWTPPSSGQVFADPKTIHYVPTKPYMCEGFFADLVTYPVRATEADAEAIRAALQAVKLGYLLEREGFFRTYQTSWDMQLSLGEQQRLAVARVLLRASSYRWALLDECTSAVALDGEEDMYRKLLDANVRVVTASQKPWLLSFHSQVVQINEEATWEFRRIEDNAEEAAEKPRLPDFVYQDKRQAADDQQPETAGPPALRPSQVTFEQQSPPPTAEQPPTADLRADDGSPPDVSSQGVAKRRGGSQKKK